MVSKFSVSSEIGCESQTLLWNIEYHSGNRNTTDDTKKNKFKLSKVLGLYVDMSNNYFSVYFSIQGLYPAEMFKLLRLIRSCVDCGNVR